jgi:3-oxoacyl-(acyl-carrier-protein) synthase
MGAEQAPSSRPTAAERDGSGPLLSPAIACQLPVALRPAVPAGKCRDREACCLPMDDEHRVVCTGMGINTRLGDTLDEFYQNLMQGKSGLGLWSFHADERVYSKVGGDLSAYDTERKVQALSDKLPGYAFTRVSKICRVAPFSTRLSVLTSVDAWLNAGLPFSESGEPSHAVLVGGHNLNEGYLIKNHHAFQQEPDWIEARLALLDMDTDHAASIGEVLGCLGAQYTLGGACASANIALRSALDEIRVHGHDVVIVTGATLDFSPMGLHALALMGAITCDRFNDNPEAASRPYDLAREGFAPAHGTASLVLERLSHARRREARVYGELLGVAATSDANHLPNPSTQGQTRTLKILLERTGVAPEQVDFVSAHATSTPQGDLSELKAIRAAFGAHAERIKINAPKSMLGHTCWSAPAVETVAALLQMQRGRLHPSINIENPDPAVDLDVCANRSVELEVRTLVKNAFGFGGTNCCALWQR